MPPPPDVDLDRPRLCVVGPMLGGHAGRVASQGETLAALLEDEGSAVVRTSTALNPLLRAGRIATDLVRRRDAYDVALVMVFSGNAFAYVDLAGAIARRLGKKVVLHLHGGDLPAFAGRHPAWVGRVLDRADVLVAPSGYLAGAFRTSGREVVVIPNVVALEDYVYRERHGVVRPRLLWMRAFEPLYRPLAALEVLARVRRVHPEATLTMAGPDGGMASAVRERAAAMGLGRCVALPGVLDGAGKRRAFAEHDILLTTSRVDNAPVSVLEGLASGLPVVAMAVGGLPDLLTDGQDAVLVPDGDVDGMAAAVVGLIDGPELAARLSRHGRALAERSDWPRVRPTWDALLAGLVGSVTGPGGRSSKHSLGRTHEGSVDQ